MKESERTQPDKNHLKKRKNLIPNLREKFIKN